METTKMIFYGAGGHAKVIIESWLASGGSVVTVFDDDASRREILGYKVAGAYVESAHQKDLMIVAVGNNRTRKTLADRVRHKFGKVLHPSVLLSPSCKVGEGTVMMAGSIVSSSSSIGAHAIINHKSCIDHDCSVGDFVHIAPGATICGDVSIGEGTLIGAGATVMPGVRIGNWATVGAGSVVSRDVPDFAIAVGLPARVIKYVDGKHA